MNNTRKAIIEKIENYMEKTLSEGCLVKVYNEIDNYHKGDSEIGRFLEGDIDSGTYMTSDFVTHQLDYHNPIILGHYDITAVLKYIDKTLLYWIDFDCYISEKDSYFIVIKNNDGEEERVGIFPNKPLHLYTEQEEKDLLELLNLLDK